MGAPQAWSTVIDHTSNAAMQAWLTELDAKLQAAGLTQTADTGQLNPATVVRPGVSTDAGYLVYYLTGALHATAPVYIKLYPGTDSSATAPRLRWEIGTGTNGAGTITGTAKTAIFQGVGAGIPISTAIARTSYCSASNGHFMLFWKIDGSTVGFAMGGLVIGRIADNTGAYTGDGILIDCMISAAASNFTGHQCLGFQPTARVYAATGAAVLGTSFVPGNETSSLTGGVNTQIYLAWGLKDNQSVSIPAQGAVYLSEAPINTTFISTPIAAVPHTYLSLGTIFGRNASAANLNISLIGRAVLWEA